MQNVALDIFFIMHEHASISGTKRLHIYYWKLHHGYKKVTDAGLTKVANDIKSSHVKENVVVDDAHATSDGT